MFVLAHYLFVDGEVHEEEEKEAKEQEEQVELVESIEKDTELMSK